MISILAQSFRIATRTDPRPHPLERNRNSNKTEKGHA